MGKLREMNGYVRMTLDKLIGIRADLVRTDDNWQEWKFTHLVEALRKWTERNPLPMDHERSEHFSEKFNHKQPKRGYSKPNSKTGSQQECACIVV